MAFIYVTQPGTTVAVNNGDIVVIDIPGGGDVTIVAASPNVRNFRIDYGDGPEDDIARVDLSTFSSSNLQIQARGYDSDDSMRLEGAFNTNVDPAKPGDFTYDFVGADGNTHTGFVRLKDVGERDFLTDPPPIIICFASGTVIDTDLGPRPIDGLKVGDLVMTADHGLEPVRWIGRRHLDAAELAENPHLRPVTIRAGAMGEGLPWTDLTVSPQHRIRLSDWRAEVLFGDGDVLAAAKTLIDGKTVVEAEVSSVTYFHLLFDRHEIVRSNGIESESLHPGEMALSALGSDGVAELESLFAEDADLHRRATARRVLKAYEARAIRGWRVAS